MQGIVSKNYKLFTEYRWKKALMNSENKRYLPDSSYSWPFWHPWIQKIEFGEMTIVEAVECLNGEDNYEYVLDAEKVEENSKKFSVFNVQAD